MTPMVTSGLDRWSPSFTCEGYRIRLIDLLDPHSDGAALAEAIAASLYSRLAEGEKANFPSTTTLLADPSLRDCLPLVEDGLYTINQMADVFSAYHKHLFICDLDPKTKARYWEVVNSYILSYTTLILYNMMLWILRHGSWRSQE